MGAAQKKSAPSKPSWIKNTYFWWASALFILGIAGIIKGSDVIRDPGQLPESHLPLIYIGAGIVMAVNGYISHLQTVEAYKELVDK